MILKAIIVILISVIIGVTIGTIANFYYKISLYNLNLSNTQKLIFIYKSLSKEYFKKYLFSKSELNKMINEKIKSISNEYNYNQKNVVISKNANIRLEAVNLAMYKNYLSYFNDIEENYKNSFDKNSDIEIVKNQKFNEVKKWELKF